MVVLLLYRQCAIIHYVKNGRKWGVIVGFLRKFNIKKLSETPIIKLEKAVKNIDEDIDEKFQNRNVLVGVIRNQYQLDSMLKNNFYHIPIAQVNECAFPVEYVAIYQSKKRYGKKSGIRYYGKVESCSTVPRNKITEIPKDSNEKYIYFKISQWYRLEKPIEAKQMDKIAFSTTMYLLKNSKTSPELEMRSQEEFEFCRILTDKIKTMVKKRIPNGDDIVYKDYTIKLKGGMLCLYFADVVEYAIGYDVFLENPMNVIRDIFDYYPEIK